MNRRDFLGTAFATIIATKQPFIAKPADVPFWTGRPKLLITALWCGMIKPEDCTSRLLAENTWIQGPKYLKHEFDLGLTIQYQPLRIHRAVTIDRMIIAGPNGWLQEAKMPTVHYAPGDELRLTYCVNV